MRKETLADRPFQYAPSGALLLTRINGVTYRVWNTPAYYRLEADGEHQGCFVNYGDVLEKVRELVG